ncbi:MAG: polysaccharide deacetylase family protein [Solirubrobacterales bacterium]
MKYAIKFIQLSVLVMFLCLMIPFNAEASEKKVYITFDDGPTFITEKFLDVLKNENVKATFFVVGKEVQGREAILKRIYEEGHAIGLHTYSHNLRKIYRNDEYFIEEMVKTSEKIKEVTGNSPKIIRFPGGSSKRLNQNLLNSIHAKGFKIYDWTSDIYDGEYPKLSVYRFVENSKKSKGDPSKVIILMHCNSNNKNTVKALPQIIKYYRESGYDILPINEDTEEYYYKF